MRAHPLGATRRSIGEVVDEHAGMVVMRSRVGGERVVTMLAASSCRESADVEKLMADDGDAGTGQRRSAVNPGDRAGAQARAVAARPVKTVHVFWLAGMSCDGCSIAVTGATNPGIEGLLPGIVPAMPKVMLHHPVLAVEAGARLRPARSRTPRHGELGDPYVVVFEGSVADERIAQRTGGYFSAMGVEAIAGEADHGASPVSDAPTWLHRLAPGAAATIAIGTCATWGGIPAAEGNPTGSMSVMDFLGKDYRSALGLPVINIPGCAPVGDNFTETVFAVLLFLQGLGPLPGVRRARPAGMALRRDRAPGLHAGRLLRGRHVRRATTATRSASSRSAAGDRWSTATSSSAARSTTWAAA